MAALRFDRVQVLTYRCAVQGLSEVGALDVLGVGLQDTPAGSAWIGLAARPHVGDPDLVVALTVRGAPHLHRRADLDALRVALRPRDTAELATYLGGYGETVRGAGVDGQALVDQVAVTMRAVFPGETVTKGELSGAVSPELPPIARPWCEGCGAHHVAEGLFRIGTLLAGIELVPDGGRQLRFRFGAGTGRRRRGRRRGRRPPRRWRRDRPAVRAPHRADHAGRARRLAQHAAAVRRLGAVGPAVGHDRA